MKIFKIYIILSTSVLFSCSNIPSSENKLFTEDQLVLERTDEVWAFRSVLDSKIRMLSLGLHDELWVAYDTENSSLYKAWKGGIDFAGPVYGRGGGQPVSKGNTYLMQTDDKPWVVSRNGLEIKPEIKYKGHTIYNNQISIEYDIIIDKDTINVVEKPEYYELPGGRIGFKRQFTSNNIPPDIEVGIKLYLESVTSVNDIVSNGNFEIKENDIQNYNNSEFKEISGVLYLESKREINIGIVLTPKPYENDVNHIKSDEEVAYGMMENYGCNTCHGMNEYVGGPAYREIAGRYSNTIHNQNALSGKIVEGGAGNWGDVAMIPHPDIPEEDVRDMVAYILNLSSRRESDLNDFIPESDHLFVFDIIQNDNHLDSGNGIAFNIYQLDYELYGFPQITDDMIPQKSGYVNILNAFNEDIENEIEDFDRNFAVQAKGELYIENDSNVEFRLVSNDGSRIFINGELIVETESNMAAVKEGRVYLEEGKHSFIYEYYKRGGDKRFSLQWRKNEFDNFSIIPPERFTFNVVDIKEAKSLDELKVESRTPTAGDGLSLEDLHPSFDLSQARPDDFHPKVSGMDFMSNGKLVVSTWDSVGVVYTLDGVMDRDPNTINVKKIASGLAEPLGLKVVDDEIYVLQKHELTKLVDINGDGTINQYRTVNNDWTSTDNHHEFAFGLLYDEGYFYGALSVAIEGPGPSAPNQAPDRGKVFKISKDNGTLTYLAEGLRTPNGIYFGVDDEIFISDNQGDWLPANKIVHLQKGSFYGHRNEDQLEIEETPPVVWLEQDKIGNSPSQPIKFDIGPYKNQMIHGDVTHGGLKRVFAEKINDSYQGAVFRFSQGFEAGVNRLVWGPDNALYVGGIGNGGNWGHSGKLHYGLQKMTYNGVSTFEMLAVRAQSNGIEIEFTEPLKSGVGINESDYTIKQWWYKPTGNYGGPNMDEEDLDIKDIRISENQKKVTLELPGMKEGHVIYMRLNKDNILSIDEKKLWTTEAWYTMNNIPE